MNIVKKCCSKIPCSKKISKKKSNIEIIPNKKIVVKKIEPINKLRDTILPVNVIKIEEKAQMLMCTHCGGKVKKPVIPSKYIIYCLDCFRPLDLPDIYYNIEN
jgi:hypothetical protein